MATDPFLGRRLYSATRLRRYELRIERAVTQALAAHKATAERTIRASAVVDPFDLNGWDDAVRIYVDPEVEAVLRDASADAVRFLTLPPAVRARVLGVIDVDAQAATFVDRIKGIGPLVADHLRANLNAGLALGESIPKLQERVEASFAVGEARSEMISRTETHSSAMLAGNEAAGALHDSGIPLVKRWLTSGDERVRESHSEMEGVAVPFDAVFLVPTDDGSVDEMMWPGDPSGSAANVISCRCDALYEEAEAGDELADEGA